jgi:hypothetical protein
MTTDNDSTFLTVQELADRLRLKPSWVYDNADALGAYRLGKYLRFSLSRVLDRIEQGTARAATFKPPTQRPSPTPTNKIVSDTRGTNREQNNK